MGSSGSLSDFVSREDMCVPIFVPHASGVESYYYDQLGSYYSDQPDEPELWELPRFVDEVEQVRQALGLDADSFYLYGHSWGGMLAIEYAENVLKDTMDPEHMERMAGAVQNGRYLYCPEGSHCALYDDQQVYMDGLIAFIKDVDAGRFP